MAAPSFTGLVPWAIPYAQYLYQVAELNGLRPRITSIARTRQQQAVLYDRYLRGQNPYPVAPPGSSRHERGLAWDMVVDRAADLGSLWKSMGGQWSPSDSVHWGIPG